MQVSSLLSRKEIREHHHDHEDDGSTGVALLQPNHFQFFDG